MSNGSQQSNTGSSPASRGPAGAYIEGELGAFYLLALLLGVVPRGLPSTKLREVRFQGADQDHALDDLILVADGVDGEYILEIQSKRTITFAPTDSVFDDVCKQVAASNANPTHRHLLAVATQRTSKKISGAYQDILIWAKSAKDETEFYRRLKFKGVANDDMRTFENTFRTNLKNHGLSVSDNIVWALLCRFKILEFDFEAVSPLSRTLVSHLCREALHEGDAARSEALWSSLIEIALAKGKVGSSVDRGALAAHLRERGFQLTGARYFATARKGLEEHCYLTLKNIKNDISGLILPRSEIVTSVDEALENHRFVEIRGDAGLGKSAILRNIAERVANDSTIIVLDSHTTPTGGWSAFRERFAIPSTASAFFDDIAASGGGTLFIDSLEMFTDPAQQRTVKDLLRTIGEIEGFSVLATARPEFGNDGSSWLAEDILAAFGPGEAVIVKELMDEEFEQLRAHTPQLGALLVPNHPAAPIARNLYRLSRLVRFSDTTDLKTEAMLSRMWWKTADGAEAGDVPEAKRILTSLAKNELRGTNEFYYPNDSGARSHLFGSNSLREVTRDTLAFGHDVLRDWAIALYLDEDIERVEELDLNIPVSPRIARGIELTCRMSLENNDDCSAWIALLDKLSANEADGSWRRQGLLAIVRSERANELLERCTEKLLDDGAALFRELSTIVYAVETLATNAILKETGFLSKNNGESDIEKQIASLPNELRTASNLSALQIFLWCIKHSEKLPLQAIGSVLKLFPTLVFVFTKTQFTAATAKMFFAWLMQLDLRDAQRTIPNNDSEKLDSYVFGQLVNELRTCALMLSPSASNEAKIYLGAVTLENDERKLNQIKPVSSSLAIAAPKELAALISHFLLEARSSSGKSASGSFVRDRIPAEGAFGFCDLNFSPASPAQPPFLHILNSDPETGFKLVHQLVQEAATFHMEDESDGFTLQIGRKKRFFPWKRTYRWSREARESAVTSCLMALEAWGHSRIENGEPPGVVVKDVLGPEGSCAAFLLVAIDLMLSHWENSRELLIPFVTSPELLATEHGRWVRDTLPPLSFGDEPDGSIKLQDLWARPSRKMNLFGSIPRYLGDDGQLAQVRGLLRAAAEPFGSFDKDANLGDPAFAAAYALDMLEPTNWSKNLSGQIFWTPSTAIKMQIEKNNARGASIAEVGGLDARISLAIEDASKGSEELAREVVDRISESELKTVSPSPLEDQFSNILQPALLVARDGEPFLVAKRIEELRKVADCALAKPDALYASETLRYNEKALATATLLHLWLRFGDDADRNAAIAAAARAPNSAYVAFTALVEPIISKDSRVLKSVMRVCFARYHWRRRQSWDEVSEVQEEYERKKEVVASYAVAAEVRWLDGAREPAWPKFASVRPVKMRKFRVPGSNSTKQSLASWLHSFFRIKTTIDRLSEDFRAKIGKTLWGDDVCADPQSASNWLKLLNCRECNSITWQDEVTEAYAQFSAELNGLGLDAHSEDLDRHREWNSQFYSLQARYLLRCSTKQFDVILMLLIDLPDEQFSTVVPTLLQEAQIAFLDDRNLSAARIIRLRKAIMERMTRLRRWGWSGNGGLTIEHDTGAMIAQIFLNNHLPFGFGTKSYVKPGQSDRIEPLFESLVMALDWLPQAFVAKCTMNLLLSAPDPKHLDFLLSALEGWMGPTGFPASMWSELDVGRNAIAWLEKVSELDSTIRSQVHPCHDRLERILSRLIHLGVAEAQEFAKSIRQPSIPKSN